VSSSGSTIREIANVDAPPSVGADERRLAGPSSGGCRRGCFDFITRTMPWPPGSRVGTKRHRWGPRAIASRASVAAQRPTRRRASLTGRRADIKANLEAQVEEAQRDKCLGDVDQLRLTIQWTEVRRLAP